MIKTRKQLKECIAIDFERNPHKCSIIHVLLGIAPEKYYVFKYLKTLRYQEYHTNNKNLYSKVVRIYYSIKRRRLSIKYNIYIQPNVVGKGLRINHIRRSAITLNCLKMGNYCTISHGVILGNKNGQENRAIVGDNVEFAPECKVIGKVYIGNNVVVCPGTVVIKDVPDNAIVSGVPARIVKIRDDKQSIM